MAIREYFRDYYKTHKPTIKIFKKNQCHRCYILTGKDKINKKLFNYKKLKVCGEFLKKLNI